MYKQEQKEEFISYYKRSRSINETAPQTLFTFTESFENKNKRDISLFTKDEVLEVLKAKKYRALYAAQNTMVILKHYIEYIIGTRKEDIKYNVCKEITKEEIQSCLDMERINNIILTREEIDDIQNHMFNYTDKAILECLFSGIAGNHLEDLTNLCAKQVDNRNKCIHFPDGRIIPISTKLCNLLKYAFDETEMVSYGETMRVSKVYGEKSLYKEKANTYKETNPERKFRWVLRRVVIWREYFDIPILTMKTISLSGLVHVIQNGLDQTGLSLRDYLKSEDGKKIAIIWGFKANDYVNVIYEKVRIYIE